MIRYNINRIVVTCAIIFLVIFIFINYNGEHLSKTSNETKVKKPRTDPEKFFVFSPKCKIPYVHPFSTQFLDMSNQIPYKACTADPDLFSVLYDRKKRHYILHLNQDVLKRLYLSITDLYCVYRETVAGSNDSFAM
ncbi:uncharacterized protein LOC111070501 [Drosophila obscura]|uniref:uncharacterized protein LOC111070501 n=1 Tax=Drosophila obscura TaxID=7282 RepID=UPI001BB2AD71|nr:uncharacterized protein LOC111070501 [Drosophila obscura]